MKLLHDLHAAFEAHCEHASTKIHVAMLGTGVLGALASVPWTVVVPAVGVLASTLWGTGVQMWKSTRMARMAVREREIQLEMLERQLRELPVAALHPEAVPLRLVAGDDVAMPAK